MRSIPVRSIFLLLLLTLFVPMSSHADLALSDDFNDNNLNPAIWTYYQLPNGPTAIETNQRLEITVSSTSSGNIFAAGYSSVCKLRGDFDIQVSYNLVTWPTMNGVRVGLTTELGAIERASFGMNDQLGAPREAFAFDAGAPNPPQDATTNTAGKLRMTRFGSTLTGYAEQAGQWVSIGSTTTSTGDTQYNLHAWSHDYAFADQDVRVAFDNFKVNQGQAVCPAADTDGDGLLDEWELHGVTIDPGDGVSPKYINLPLMGADPNRPDIFLQIDWLRGHQPTAAALKIVHDAFDQSPYISPTHSRGINLHIDAGYGSILDYHTGRLWADLSEADERPDPPFSPLGSTYANGNYDFTAFLNYYAKPFFQPTGRVPIFHYALFADQIAGGASGTGATPGDIFIVSLGGIATPLRQLFGLSLERQQAGSLMHELGHNLGLQHGGDEDVNGKPNYLSVMNYAFQLNGLTTNDASGKGHSNIYDYSHTKLPDLNEADLDETVGLNVDGEEESKGYGTASFCTNSLFNPLRQRVDNKFIPVDKSNGPINWNCSYLPLPLGIDTNHHVEADINGDGMINIVDPNSPNGPRLPLHGYDDWSHIRFTDASNPIGKAGITVEFPSTANHTDLTLDQASQIPPLEYFERLTIHIPLVKR